MRWEIIGDGVRPDMLRVFRDPVLMILFELTTIIVEVSILHLLAIKFLKLKDNKIVYLDGFVVFVNLITWLIGDMIYFGLETIISYYMFLWVTMFLVIIWVLSIFVITLRNHGKRKLSNVQTAN